MISGPIDIDKKFRMGMFAKCGDPIPLMDGGQFLLDVAMTRRLSRGERAAACALRAELQDEALRDLDDLHRDAAAMRMVMECVGWLL